MLKFPDGARVGMKGLVEILAQLYSEGRQPNQESSEEIIRRLEQAGNYIPSSYSVRREYLYVLLEEYRAYIEQRVAVVGPKLPPDIPAS